ncbi:MAG: glycosyltransferase [Rhodothermales bacterium]|nr:glycosyltransferase [Rhodothermales bacterium]
MQRRITLFIYSLGYGGIQRIVVRMANEFVKRGYAVNLVLAKRTGALISDVDASVNVINLNASSVLYSIAGLFRHIRNNRPHVLFSAETPINIVAIWAKLLFGSKIRLVISVRSNISEYSKNEAVWYSRFTPILVRVFYRYADALVTVSQGVLDDLKAISKSAFARGTVIYNPVVDLERSTVSPTTAPHRWLDDRDVPVLLAVGRLTAQKNYPVLLQAFADARKSRNMRLIILGGGKMLDDLINQCKKYEISEHVHFAGFVDNTAAYYSFASLFVLSSDYEGFGSVLVEAMAHGCPVVSTDCPSGPREILMNGTYGALVSPGDASALSNAILKSLENSPDIESLKSRAADFSVDKSISQYLALFFPEESSI